MYIKKLFVAFRSTVNPRRAYKSLGKVLKPRFPIKLFIQPRMTDLYFIHLKIWSFPSPEYFLIQKISYLTLQNKSVITV